MKKGLKGYFVTGLLVVVPLYITVYVLALIVRFMDNIFAIVPAFLQPDAYLPFHIPGLGIFFTIAGIFIVGVLATNIFGKWVLKIAERIVSRLPILRMVYNASKQFLETFFSKEQDGARKVVLVEFPRKGAYSVGFLTGKTRGEVKEKTADSTVNVFIPTTPNPTSGFYIIVAESEVIPLDMKVEDAFKVLMTGGMVVPDSKAGFKVITPQKVS